MKHNQDIAANKLLQVSYDVMLKVKTSPTTIQRTRTLMTHLQFLGILLDDGIALPLQLLVLLQECLSELRCQLQVVLLLLELRPDVLVAYLRLVIDGTSILHVYDVFL